MKTGNVIRALPLMVGMALSSCNQTPIDDGKDLPPAGQFTYYNTIEIDSTASACGVDSCVINLPWLNDKINAFLKDSAERRTNITTSLQIDLVTYADNTDGSDMTYYSYRVDDIPFFGTLWFDCDGDTVWQDPDWFVLQNDTMICSDKDEYFINILDERGKMQLNKTIVHIELGLFPWI